MTPLRVGVISDTHGLLRPEALARLRGCDRILHAGDIGAPHVLEALSDLAPTQAIRGNVDRAPWARVCPETLDLRLGGVAVHLVHDLAAWDPAATGPEPRVVISGHSHRARVHREGGTLFLNPGSAGPRRFRLPVTLAMLLIRGGRARPVILPLL